MKRWFSVLASLALVLPTSPARAQALHDPLLDRMIGEWVMEGTIGGAQVTHDVTVEWVLERQYVRIYELAREREADGRPAYEAIVLIGWDAVSEQYVCLWLDSTGGSGLASKLLGYAKVEGDSLPFLFHGPEFGPFHTTFAYAASSDTWQWHMDAEGDDGTRRPFARVTLSRK